MKSYLELVERFPLVSIRSAAQLKKAQQVVDRLLAENLDAGGRMYLEALSDLVAAYEEENISIAAPSDADLLQHLLEARGISQTTLCQQTGIAASSISAILSGKRTFTKDMVAKLAAYFRVDRGLLAANF